MALEDPNGILPPLPGTITIPEKKKGSMQAMVAMRSANRDMIDCLSWSGVRQRTINDTGVMAALANTVLPV